MKVNFDTVKVQNPPFVQAREQTGKIVRAYEDTQAQLKQTMDIPVQQAMQKLQKISNVFNRQVRFNIDQTSKRVVVSVIDSDTNEVIRQIPSQEILHMIQEIDKIIGRFIDYKG